MEQRCIALRRLGGRLGTFGIANPGIMKVTVVGAGNVGATCANVLATREVANEVVLLDIKDGFAEGKALDIWETAPINLYDTRTVVPRTITARRQVQMWWLSPADCHANRA